MFNSIKGFIRKVGIRMGLIKKLESITDLQQVAMPAEFYEKIIQWREMHRGFHAPMHEYFVHTVKDGRVKKCRNSLQLPKVIANELSSIIFNERAEVIVSEEKYNQYIQQVLSENKFNGKFQNFLEFMFAQGGGVVKPYYKNGKIKLSFVTADCFLPISWDNEGIKEGVFVSESFKDGKYYTHLEFHTFENGNYVVSNQLFESANVGELGVNINLNVLFDDLEPRVEISGVERPLFAYFSPATANNIDPLLPLGISIYGNSYDTLKAADIIFDSYIREFRLGKKRIIVPAQMVKTVHDPNTGEFSRYFDDSDETYEALPGNMDQDFIKDVSTELRVEEHISALNSMLNLLALQVGFSPNAFSFNGSSGLKTATEVVSENSKTFRTKQSHENVIEQSLNDLIRAIGDVSMLYGLFNVPADYDVTVNFDDSIANDRQSDIAEQQLLLAARIQSRLRAIKKIHGLNDEEAMQLLREIDNEELNSSPTLDEVRNEVFLGGPFE